MSRKIFAKFSVCFQIFPITVGTSRYSVSRRSSTPVRRVYLYVFVRHITGPDRCRGLAFVQIDDDLNLPLLERKRRVALRVLALAQAFLDELALADVNIRS